MKEWEKYFAVQWSSMWSINRGAWHQCYRIFNLSNGSLATKRGYSHERDAKRAAAQIYNRIDKILLGKTDGAEKDR